MKFKFIWCLGISTNINFIVSKLHLGAYEGWRSKAVAKYFNKTLFRISHFYILAWIHVLFHGLSVYETWTFPCPMTISLICYPKAPILFRLLLSHIFTRTCMWKGLPFLLSWLFPISTPLTNGWKSWIQQCWQQTLPLSWSLDSMTVENSKLHFPTVFHDLSWGL